MNEESRREFLNELSRFIEYLKKAAVEVLRRMKEFCFAVKEQLGKRRAELMPEKGGISFFGEKADSEHVQANQGGCKECSTMTTEEIRLLIANDRIDKFYNRGAWRRKSKDILKRDNNECRSTSAEESTQGLKTSITLRSSRTFRSLLTTMRT